MHTSTVEHEGSRVTVTVEWPEYLDADTLSATGLGYLTALLAQMNSARELAASSLLATYNDSWADDTHPRLSQDQFMARLQLEAVQLLDEPEVACLLFKDGDMFGGHAIVVDFEATTPTHASLFG